jgi:glycine cleavage system transcriptional repressor
MEGNANAAVWVVGSDRPGIVAGVTRELYGLGCNLLDAASTILRGHFAMMLMVEAPPDCDVERIRSALVATAGELGISVTVQPVTDAGRDTPTATHMVSVYGADKPGIVFRVTEALAETGGNITDLTSRVIGSHEEPVYALMLEVDLPEAARQRLEQLASELQVEISIHPLESDLL